MMTEEYLKNNAKNKDRILRFAVENIGDAISEKQAKNHLHQFNLSEDIIELLFEEIKEYNTLEKIAKIESGDFGIVITGTELTKKFIDIGGFEMQLNLKLKKDKETEQFLNVKIEKDRVDLELAKKMLEEYPFTKKKANISFIISIILAILTLVLGVIQLYNQINES